MRRTLLVLATVVMAGEAMLSLPAEAQTISNGNNIDLLRGFDRGYYVTFVGDAHNARSPCQLDMRSASTRLSFLVSQTPLRLTWLAPMEAGDALYRRQNEVTDELANTPQASPRAAELEGQLREIRQELDRYQNPLVVSFTGDVFEVVPNYCAVLIELRVTASVDGARLRPTGTAFIGRVEIWEAGWFVPGARGQFQENVERVMDNMMRAFLTDWMNANR
jgi:hypothetical protein